MDEENQKQDLIQPEPTDNIVYRPPVVPKPEIINSDQTLPPFQPQEPKKKHKKTTFMIIVLLLILIISGGAGAYYYSKTRTNNSDKSVPINQQSQNNTADTSQFADVAATVVAVNSMLKEKYPSAQPDMNGMVIAPFYKPVGANYYVYPAKSTDLFIPTSNQSDDIAKDIKSLLLNNDFKESSISHPNLGRSTPILLSSTVLCNLDSSYGPINLACANLTDYSAAVMTIEPFAQVDRTNDPSQDEGSMIYGAPFMKNSATSGYRIASIYSTSTPGLAGSGSSVYYKKDNGDWVYFTNVYSSNGTAGGPGECIVFTESDKSRTNPYSNMTADESDAFNGMTCDALFNFSVGR